MCKKLFFVISISLALLMTSTAFGALIYHYPLDEAAGSTEVLDIVTGTQKGVLNYGTLMGATGAIGGAAEFGSTYVGGYPVPGATNENDREDHIRIQVPAMTPVSGTVAFFAQMNDNHYWNYMFGMKDNVAGTDRLQLGSNHRFPDFPEAPTGDWAFAGYGKDWDEVRDGSQPLAQNKWYHIATTWSRIGGTTHFINYALYVNGALVASGTEQGLANMMQDADIGADGDNHGKGMMGLIDDVMIFDNALTQSDIQGLYPGIPEPATIALLGLGGLVLLRRKRR